ncbi:MAG: FAD-dependent oxidoreductase [Acidobacteriia bacterium]|nr:FAD-dependent oxidoreductase [Terriglobia bacterium]
MHRRQFLETAGGLLLAPGLSLGRELACDVAVIGGGTGGCAAALAAARNGVRVVLTEETGWIGGQLTSQAVPPDEHAWIESFGSTRTYRDYRERVRDYYRRNYPLTEQARRVRELNPGNSRVSRLTHEPRVSLAVLEEMLAPFVSGGQIVVLLRHKPVAADTAADRIRSVTLRDLETGRDHTISAPYFLDATEQGDLLPLAGVEYVTGAESSKETGEPHAPAEAHPAAIQAFTYCFAMDHVPGEDQRIEKPADYEFWRSYVPDLRPAWPGKLLSWTVSDPITLAPRTHPFDPMYDLNHADGGLWLYRRIADRRNFSPGAYASDICLVNWPQNDYCLGNILDVGEAEAARHRARARQLSLSLLFWMQTEAPRGDRGLGWPGLRLRRDITGTEDGLAMHPYIRESRRIRAEFTVLEQHVGATARGKLTGKLTGELTAAHFEDSVGIGSYRIDLHPSSGGENYIDISSLPFQIPMGALIPRRVENLLAAAKNLGVTHITNGCYRLHPVEWNTGESAGLLAARAIQLKTEPRRIRSQEKLRAEFQEWIQDQGVEIAWPRLTPR